MSEKTAAGVCEQRLIKVFSSDLHLVFTGPVTGAVLGTIAGVACAVTGSMSRTSAGAVRGTASSRPSAAPGSITGAASRTTSPAGTPISGTISSFGDHEAALRAHDAAVRTPGRKSEKEQNRNGKTNHQHALHLLTSQSFSCCLPVRPFRLLIDEASHHGPCDGTARHTGFYDWITHGQRKGYRIFSILGQCAFQRHLRLRRHIGSVSDLLARPIHICFRTVETSLRSATCNLTARTPLLGRA